MEKMIVLIPAYKPEEKMLGLLEALLQYRGASADSRQDGEQAGSEDRARAGLAKEENTRIDGIVVVDDGGGDPFRALFDRAQELGCLVVRHEENRGKGAAIRTGIEAAIEHFGPDIHVVTADADGQHLPKDILRVADTTLKRNSPGGAQKGPAKPVLVLGARDFSAKDVPLRSMLGNRITSVFFRISTGRSCRDTQTGLRGIPASLMQLALRTEGDRYEYEMNFLTDAVKTAELVLIPIETVYEDDNSTSHFRPVRDSLLIYKRPLRYALTGAGSAVVDWGLFLLLLRIMGLSAFSTDVAEGAIGLLAEPSMAAKAAGAAAATARIGSGLFNFEMNRHWSFQSGGNVGREVMRYLILFFANMFCNAGAVSVLSYMGVPAALAKFSTDVVLVVVNYQVQKHWVFKAPSVR